MESVSDVWEALPLSLKLHLLASIPLDEHFLDRLIEELARYCYPI